jgi:hypothetical protein
MKAAAVAILAILLALGGVLGFLAFIRSERTDCFASFDSHGAAERAAVLGRAAGFDDVDVEASGPKARRSTSPGARAISVTFSDGETRDDAASLRERFQEIVVQGDGEFSDPACMEKSRSD